MQTDWKVLSEAASREQDPEKLLDLVEQLDRALEQCENALKQKDRVSGVDSIQRKSMFPSEPPNDMLPRCA